jgi:hypothetical protein
MRFNSGKSDSRPLGSSGTLSSWKNQIDALLRAKTIFGKIIAKNPKRLAPVQPTF